MRQVNKFFDYSKWNDEMNRRGGLRKGKPDKKKKRKKVFKL